MAEKLTSPIEGNVTYKQLLFWMIPVISSLLAGFSTYMVNESSQNERIRTLEILLENSNEDRKDNTEIIKLTYEAVKQVETRLIRLEVKEELKNEKE